MAKVKLAPTLEINWSRNMVDFYFLKCIEYGAFLGFSISSVLVALALPITQPRVSVKTIHLVLNFVIIAISIHLILDFIIVSLRYCGWIS